MRIKAGFRTACGVALLLVALLIWRHAVVTTREIERALAARVDDCAHLEAELHRQGARLDAAQAGRAEPAGALEEAASGKPAAPHAVEVAQTSSSAPVDTRRLIAMDPKLRTRYYAWQRSIQAVEYGPFFHARGLSPELLEKFVDNQIRYQTRDMDIAGLARSEDAPGRATISALKEQSKREHEAAQVELLGADGYAQLQQYVETLPLFNCVITPLIATTAFEGIPLTVQQSDHLWRALIEATREGASEYREKLATLDWEIVDAQAAQLLSPAQFELFQSAHTHTGFRSRWDAQLDAAIARAKAADDANASW